MKILNLTTKTAAPIVSPETGKATHYVEAGAKTELGYMPGGLAVYVRRVGDDRAQVVPMGSVAKLTVDMPAMGKEVTIVPGSPPPPDVVADIDARIAKMEGPIVTAKRNADGSLTYAVPPADTVTFGAGMQGPPEAFGLPSAPDDWPTGDVFVKAVDRVSGAVTIEPVHTPAVALAGGASAPGKTEALRQAGAEIVRPSRREKRRKR